MGTGKVQAIALKLRGECYQQHRSHPAQYRETVVMALRRLKG
ncbi:hypothetical protein [Nodosilinea sp. E11]|nr:hypothetical protein [Nodosilinea sp. E11]WOD37399.1 hypothetical protein RRF56_14410 [Nodosilinea sp. E11]